VSTINIDIADKSEQRKFGIVMAVAFVVLGLIRWGFKGFAMESLPLYLWGVAVPFLVLGIVWPGALKPLFYLWIKLAIVLNFVMTRFFLAITFYAMMTPIGILKRLFGGDVLHRDWNPDASTYWKDADDQPNDLDSYKRQF